ncbi:hypothetical protein CANARDRAFT_30510 [[Candida] arabinofermentans NRRL YB-2248]|uniref:SET domain-containing protein n=1 Tax=[Candida] arabinofermentans NRRL YB-2248 TaxID=983967 RepID=A0A1E4STP1_9ASCO|nr:hypothetical protein CANARDRAFT_30510 [[Candida] arabinofermentans NRRL YB-2248]
MSFVQDTTNFEKWLQQSYKFVSPKFTIADLRAQHQGRGLIAQDDIAKDEVLFELSRDTILNVDTASLSSLKDGNRDILNSLNQWESLILCFSYELMIDVRSKWFHYFKVLPNEFQSLMFWSQDDLDSLKPSNVLNRIGKEAAEEMYAKLVPDYCVKLGCKELGDFLTLEKFHVVATLIMSYSFDVDHPEEVEDDEEEEGEEEEEQAEEEHVHEDEEDEDEHNHQDDDDDGDDDDEEEDEQSDCVQNDTYFKSMVPLADTLNANTSLFNATLNYESDKLVMLATKNIKKGEQIYNIYGELPNSEILRKYGYVELPSSKHEFVDLPLSTITNYFANWKNVAGGLPLIEGILKLIGESEYLDETLEDFEGGVVLNSYEIFTKGEVLPELEILLSILSTLYLSFEKDPKWFKRLVRGLGRDDSDFSIFINRVILKSYQLLENGMLTEGCLNCFKGVVQSRLAEYPDEIVNGEFVLPTDYASFDRSKMAKTVLKNEVDCLQQSLEQFPGFNDDGKPKFKIIDDEKLLNNVLKRKLEQESKKKEKRQKK